MKQQYYLERVKFLLIDDNAFMRTIYHQVLSTFGVQGIQEASDGAEALKILQSWNADIILLDWEMMPFDGIEFTQMIRQQTNSTAFLPIIMISGHSEHWRIAKARDVGINEFLAKPISANNLLARIHNVIHHPRPFIKTHNYFGPDRRRHNLEIDIERRQNGPVEAIHPVAHTSFPPNIAQMPQYRHAHGPQPTIGGFT